MPNRTLVLTLALALSACAHAPGGEPSAGPASAFEKEGMALAQRRCATCHATGPSGVSPRPTAPTFRQLGVRFNTITWERVMAEITAGGHDEMPSVPVTPDQGRRLRAYMESLDARR